MSSYIQLICLIFSFLYGIVVNYLNKFNLLIIKNKNCFIKLIIISLYIFNITLFYTIILYKLNYGVLHHYFVLFILLGYIFVNVKKRKL